MEYLSHHLYLLHRDARANFSAVVPEARPRHRPAKQPPCNLCRHADVVELPHPQSHRLDAEVRPSFDGRGDIRPTVMSKPPGGELRVSWAASIGAKTRADIRMGGAQRFAERTTEIKVAKSQWTCCELGQAGCLCCGWYDRGVFAGQDEDLQIASHRSKARAPRMRCHNFSRATSKWIQ